MINYVSCAYIIKRGDNMSSLNVDKNINIKVTDTYKVVSYYGKRTIAEIIKEMLSTKVKQM